MWGRREERRGAERKKGEITDLLKIIRHYVDGEALVRWELLIKLEAH